MARKSKTPITPADARAIGELLRNLRRAAGFRAVQQAADHAKCPAARQTIYAYERKGGLVPSLPQFLELVEFYALLASPADDVAIRHEAVAAIVQALALPVYHVSDAMDLIGRLQVGTTTASRR